MSTLVCANCGAQNSITAKTLSSAVQCKVCCRILSAPPAADHQTSSSDSAYSLWPSRGAQLVVIVLLAGTATAVIFGNGATRFFFLLVALVALNGYRVGGARIAATLIGLVVAALLARPLGALLEDQVAAVLGTSGIVNRLSAFAFASMTLLIVVAMTFSLLFSRWLRRNERLRRYNAWLGLGLGLVEGTVLGVLLFWTELSLEPVAASRIAVIQRDDVQVESSPLAEAVVAAAESTRNSLVGRAADATNPLVGLRLIALSNKWVLVINDPRKRERFARHAAIKGLTERPGVIQSLAILRSDPEVMRRFEPGGSMTAGDIRALLESPTVLRVLDETNVADELQPILRDLERALDDTLSGGSGEPSSLP